jgi:Cd2+/Zn2+-exporting ATPase
MKILKFQVTGMDCAEETGILRRELGTLVGGEERLSFDILKGTMKVEARPELSPETVIEAVRKTGMQARETGGAEGVETPAGPAWRTPLTWGSGLLTVAGFTAHSWISGGISQALGSEGMGHAHGVPLVAKLLYAGAIASGVWLVLPKAAAAVRRLRPDMNLLMVVAVLGAVFIGEWFEAATVSFLFALSLLLESWSLQRARRAISALMELSPPIAHVKSAGGGLQDASAKDVAAGTLFVVKPGEKFPLDGRVIAGAGAVNQAPITGESLPVAKEPGAAVFAGSINGDGALEVESTKAASDTTLARMIRMVSDAQSKRAPSEQWVEKFARVYTPAVFALALAVLVIPPLLFGASWSEWLYRSLVLLVIGCPCALVISTPVTIVAALASAAREGVLIKGGAYIEAPARLKAVAFDKTGTLTSGAPNVTEVEGFNGHDEKELLESAAAMEAHSGHPLAKAIVAYAKARGIEPAPAANFTIIQGKGAEAQIKEKQFWLGSHRYLEEKGAETKEAHERLEALTRSGRSVVIIGNDEHVCGFIALSDTVRPQARDAAALLRSAGIEHIIMLTGDNRGTAEAIAAEVGVDEIHAELLPEDKVRLVAELVAKYGAVAMVGDGVNDAPAMARATIAVAMGAAGSDAAIETADIALMSDDLLKLPWLIGHSRRSLAVIRQNIALSLAVKALFVILAFAGIASLWSAIAADMGVSLLVIFNALRLLRPSGLKRRHI